MKYVCPDCGEPYVECIAEITMNWDLNAEEPADVQYSSYDSPVIPGWADAWCNNCECNWQGRFSELKRVPDTIGVERG